MTANFLDRLNRLIALFADTLRQIGQRRLWIILLGYLLIQWLVLYAHKEAFAAPWAWFMGGWIAMFPESMADGFTHYPEHYLLLPTFFGWAKLVIGLFLEGLVLGGLAMTFYDSYLAADSDDRLSLRLLLPSWPQLLLGWLILNGLMLAVGLLLPDLLAPLVEGSYRRQLALNVIVLPGLYALILCLMYFVIPAIAIYGDNVLQAVARSLRLVLQSPISCLVLAMTILAGPVFLSLIEMRADILVEKFRPEVVYWLLAAGLVAQMFVNFLWMGTAVRHMIEEQE